jgi:hypothetical protein
LMGPILCLRLLAMDKPYARGDSGGPVFDGTFTIGLITAHFEDRQTGFFSQRPTR